MMFMAGFIKCCAVHTPSNNPKKKPALRISDTLRRPADTLRRKRHRHGQSSRHHPQAGLSSAGGMTPSGSHGPPIPLQSSAPPDLIGPSSSSYPPHPQHSLPPLPSSASQSQTTSGGNMCHTNFQVHQTPSGGISNSQHPSIPFNPLQMQSGQPQLVVALPPEASSHSRSSGPFNPEPPPPYPGHPSHPPSHPPPLPSRPSTTSSNASSAAPLRPNLPSAAAIAGPSHGYGEGRGHYNRRTNNAGVFPPPVNPSKSSGNNSKKSGHR